MSDTLRMLKGNGLTFNCEEFMFATACEIARSYTHPYAGLRRKHDGTVFSTMGAFMVVNAEGWAVTAKHIFDEIGRAQASIRDVQKVDAEIAAVQNEIAQTKGRRKKLRKLERHKEGFLSNHAEMWVAGADWQQTKPRVAEAHFHAVADLAAFRLEPFTPTTDQRYPVLRSSDLPMGSSVCRIGFPWHSVPLEFDNNNFNVTGGFPAPLFALDGIVSRFLQVDDGAGNSARYVQTSAPGLRGQSGGPLFDVQGHLCGVQASTTHLDLGFDAHYERENKRIVERQFLNVGQAVHIDDVRSFLDSVSVAYDPE